MTQNKPPYTKQHLTISEQINQLENRGMIFNNVPKAAHYLSHINYYRLKAYWLPYKESNPEFFRNDTNFDEVLCYYIFDRELRLLVLDAIERIEVSVRTRMTFVLTEKYDSHPHLNRSIYSNEDKYNKNLDKLKSEYRRSKEVFVKHFKDNYEEELPPLWAVTELMTLGQVSNWFSNIKLRVDRNAISSIYSMDEKVLKSYLHQLTIIRNISAHHARLWNKRFTFTSKIPNYPPKFSEAVNRNSRKSLYNILVFLKCMMDSINHNHSWGERLKNLINKDEINIGAMGFPEDWERLNLWKE